MSFKYHHYICRGLSNLYFWVQTTVRSKYDSLCHFIAKSNFNNILNHKMILIIIIMYHYQYVSIQCFIYHLFKTDSNFFETLFTTVKFSSNLIICCKDDLEKKPQKLDSNVLLRYKVFCILCQGDRAKNT